MQNMSEDDEQLQQGINAEREEKDDLIEQMREIFPRVELNVIADLVNKGIGLHDLVDKLSSFSPEDKQNSIPPVTSQGSTVTLLEDEKPKCVTRNFNVPDRSFFEIQGQYDENQWNNEMLTEALWAELIRRAQSAIVAVSKFQVMAKETSSLKYFLRDQFPEIRMPAVLNVVDNNDFYSAMIILKLVTLGAESRLLAREFISKKMMPMKLNDQSIAQRKIEASEISEPVPKAVERYWNNYREILNADYKEGLAALRFDCPVCMDAVLEIKGVACTSLSGEVDQEHRFCEDCVRGHALASSDSSLGVGGSGVRCMEPGCKGIILMARVSRLLSAEEMLPLTKRIDVEAVDSVGMTDLERCQACEYAVSMDMTKECEPVFTCQKCQHAHCRLCEKEYGEKHRGRKCEEIEMALDENRKKLEEELTASVIRKCQCGRAFDKVEGCNRMTCPCGLTSCYLCKASGIEYNHFGEGKPCVLWTDAATLQQQDQVKRAAVLAQARGDETLRREDVVGLQ